MASDISDVPDNFDEVFLDWFRARTEAAWAAIPDYSHEEWLAEYFRMGAGGNTWQRLIPIIGHRYLLAEPATAGYPVLSVYQSDIIVYGADLHDYLVFEFADLIGVPRLAIERAMRRMTVPRLPTYQKVPFWGELLGA
jgi:hypothetical protein